MRRSLLPRHLAAFRLSTCLALVVAGALASIAAAAPGPTETTRVYLSSRGADDAVAWDFFCSEGRQSGEWRKIRVPSCWEQEGYGTYNYGVRYYGKPNPPGIAREQGIYRTKFQVPEDWRGRRLRLVFEGVMTDAKVRVNGVSAGPTHQGGFYRFSHDVTDLVRYGAENELEVTVDKESANESVNLAERRADYWNFGGIFRPVFLEVLPGRFIQRVAVDARADGGFRADVFLGHAAGTSARVVGRILDAKGAEVGAPFEMAVPAGGDHVTMTAKVANPRLWSAETPELYRVRLSYQEGGVEQHAVLERFGFRTFEVRAGQGLFLNGHRILLKGVNRHSFWPETGRTLSPARNYEDARLIRSLNMNAVRMSHYPPDPEFLDACDELGLYVLDELGGWHGAYDTGVGRRLVEETVTRDVNHPSILFWDNGNEGGWNTALDAEFGRWDPQGRPVLHPQKSASGVETMHYRSYGETQEYLRGRDLFMPTEFLHGLYDGGHGAGLWDYWELMRKHPRAGGGFLWDFADAGIVRTDQGGRIDTAGNYGADGIVGPHHEKEGSFDAIREIWSPVQLGPDRLPEDFHGTLQVENRYDFTQLDACTFVWEWVRFPQALDRGSARAVVASGELRGPSLAPGASGSLTLPVPANAKDADALLVTVRDPRGEALWTWSWEMPKAVRADTGAAPSPAATFREETMQWIVSAGSTEYRFEKSTGRLAGVQCGGRAMSLSHGPRFIAARRGDRTLDGTIDPQAPKGVDRIYQEIHDSGELTRLDVRADRDRAVLVEATYSGALQRALWRLCPDGSATLDYDYGYDGVVELMGVQFDYPESSMRGLRWLGRGPYRVWQNRLQGGVLGVWENGYNDAIPAESFQYPEFKGYFQAWQWATFTTAEGELTFENGSPGSYLGVYAPRDGRDALLFTLPQTGLSFLDVIPAVRNKVNATDLIGPSSRPYRVQGTHHGRITLHFRSAER